MSFSQPSGPGGDSFAAADHNGHLVLVYPKSYQDEVQTKNGASSAAEVDIVICDKFGEDGRPLFFQNARLFGNLARSVRNDLGGQVLGRLGQGPNTRGTPPWILQNFTDQDVAMATPVDVAYRQGLFKPTENPMAPSGYGGPAPATAAPQQWQPPAAPAYATPQAPPAYNAAPSPAPAAQQWAPPVATAAPVAATQAAPNGVPQQWNQAAPTPAAAPPVQAAPPVIDPNLVQYLADRGVTVTPDMDQATCEGIARSFPS